jgi:hypothetical protein
MAYWEIVHYQHHQGLLNLAEHLVTDFNMRRGNIIYGTTCRENETHGERNHQQRTMKEVLMAFIVDP